MNIAKWIIIALVPLIVLAYSFSSFSCTDKWDPPCDIGDGCIGVAERITECEPNTAMRLAGVGASVLWLGFFVFAAKDKQNS